MADDTYLDRAVDHAIPGIVASLGAWGVTGGHRMPERDGTPALWLTTATEAQAGSLEGATWLPHQIAVILARAGVPHEAMKHLRVLVESQESHRRLLGEH